MRKDIEVQRGFSIKSFHSAYFFSWDESFSNKGECHPYLEIVCVKKGKIEVVEDEKIYTLQKNDVIVHDSMEFHRIRSVDKTNTNVIIMSFDIFGEFPESLKKGVFNISDFDIISFEDIVKNIKLHFSGEGEKAYPPQAIADKLCVFLFELSGRDTQSRSDSSASASEYRKAVYTMSENVCKNLTLEDISAICNISISYMKQIFKKHIGVSPKSYYNILRTRYIINMIDKGFGALEIADMMNFPSPNYLSVFFVKQTGKTITEYKKTI